MTSYGKVILATVQGDIHDIGKNIVKVLLENYGYDVVDLGKDVPIGKVVESAKELGIQLVGLSALMTTTVANMEKTIQALKDAGLECTTAVGGAVLTEDYAKKNRRRLLLQGCDGYGEGGKPYFQIRKIVRLPGVFPRRTAG